MPSWERIFGRQSLGIYSKKEGDGMNRDQEFLAGLSFRKAKKVVPKIAEGIVKTLLQESEPQKAVGFILWFQLGWS